MKSDSSLILAGFLLILAAAAILAFSQVQKETEGKLEMSAYTDKDLYHSGETMSFLVNLSEGVENSTLSITGIKDSSGKYRIQQEYLIPAGQLQNHANFTFAMPSCYGCAGISPGDYEIYAELVSNNVQVANATKMVRLEK